MHSGTVDNVCICLVYITGVIQQFFINHNNTWDVSPSAGGPDVSITQHSEQRAAAAPVFLTEGQSVLSACIDPLIRSHGMWGNFKKAQTCMYSHKQCVHNC